MNNHELDPGMTPESPLLTRPDHTESFTVVRPQGVASEKLGHLSLSDVMHEEHIDLGAVRNLARGQVAQAFDAAQRYSDFAPAVASAIVHDLEPTTEVIKPTAAQIKQQSFGARFVAGFLGIFSDRLARRFDRYLEKKAAQKVEFVARRTRYAIDTISAATAPKAQFVDDIAHMYADVRHNAAPQQGLLRIADSLVGGEEGPYEYTGRLANLSGLSNKVDKLTLKAFAPEILRGIEQFLRRQGVELGQPAQVLEHRSVVRSIAQRLAPGVLRQIPDRVEAMLTNIHGILPEDGDRFRDSVYKVCKNLEARALRGENGRDLTDSILEEMRRRLR